MNHTRQVNVGGVRIGGGAPIAIQSMSTFSPTDTARAAAQINALGAAGADIVRVAVPDKKAAEALRDLRALTEVPIVADIHFDYRLALTAMEAGVDGLRINPGNIGRRENVVKVVEMARQTGTPIRIGINAGSLPQDLLDAAGGHPTAEGMVEGALRHVRILEEENFRDIVISVKSSDVPMMVRANRILAEQTEYPLHLGVTEAGTEYRGTVKSAIGIGALLLDGIGDTIRVSLTDDPLKEVRAAREILSSLGIQQYGPVLISCPTCGRTQVNLIHIAQEVEERLKEFKSPLRIAVMGCAVNGPGEAREADFGIACGKGSGLLFSKGQVLRSVPENELIDALLDEIRRYEEQKQ
jgi:4-hydroxy-3-methylbut-2-en-1-yl diphosphate synthase